MLDTGYSNEKKLRFEGYWDSVKKHISICVYTNVVI
jgi:hypothetical protein